MPELLRIQPRVPDLVPGQVQVPTPGGAYVGKGLSVLGETFQRIQEASDDAEIRAGIATGTARLAGTYKTADLTYTDPAQFTTEAKDQLQQTYDAVVSTGSNARVRGALKTALNDEFIKHNYQVDFGAQTKRLDIAKSNSEIFMEDAERRYANAPDPTTKTQVEAEIADHMRLMVRTGAIKPVDAVKKTQKILENDAYRRGLFGLKDATNPSEYFDQFIADNPNLDPNKLPALVSTRDSEVLKRTREQEKAEKRAKDDAVLSVTMSAISGELTLPQLNVIAANQRFTETEYKGIINAMESGGVTNPRIFTEYQVDIQSGKLTDYRIIRDSTNLGRTAKTQLINMITSRGDHYISEGRAWAAEGRSKASFTDAHHYSKSPAYQQALKEYRATVSNKGELLPLDDLEQAQYSWGIEQLWNRVGKGEDPMIVGRELKARAEEVKPLGGFGAASPVAAPRFPDEQTLIDNYQRKSIDRKEFDAESLLLKQNAAKKTAAEKKTTETPSARSRR